MPRRSKKEIIRNIIYYALEIYKHMDNTLENSKYSNPWFMNKDMKDLYEIERDLKKCAGILKLRV